jgi:hypothetical protein
LPGEEAFRQTSADISDGAAEVSDGAAEVSGMAAEPGDAAGDCLRGLICPIFFCCTPCRANQELYGTLAVLSNKSVTLKAA